MRKVSLVSMLIIPILLSGCVVSSIVTAPFKAAGTVIETAVDATTQTQSEKEEDVGRKVMAQRKAERKKCLDQADSSRERRACKNRYNDY